MADDPSPSPADAAAPSPALPRPTPQARQTRPPRESDARPSGRPPLNVIALLLIGAAAGAFGTLTWDVRPTTRVITATVAAIDDSAVAVLLDHPTADQGYGITGVLWREAVPEGQAEEPWRRSASPAGHPTCLSPQDVGRPVSVGLVTDPGGAGRPPSEVVVWLECGPSQDDDPDAGAPAESSPGDG